MLTPNNPTMDLPDTPLGLSTIPPELQDILQESFLEKICEKFRNASHDGPFEVAQETGLAVLAFYVLIYPPNYPQIGTLSFFSNAERTKISRYARFGNGQDRVE